MSKLISSQISPFAKLNNNEKKFEEKINKNENNYFERKDIFYKNFEKSLSQSKIPNDSIKKLGKKINEIVSKIDNSNKNILIVGNIQSGKTNSFLGVMSKVFDKDVNLSFILGGTDNNIYKQNYSRIKQLFSNSYTINEVCIYGSKDINKNFSIEKEILENLKKGKKIIIASIKNWKTITKWNEILENLKNDIISSIIIDDEADQFTLNDIKKSEKQERTATNNAIVQTLDILNEKTTLIQVTATPYAYIMIDSNDRLKPDYPFLIDRGVGYTSLSHFISNDNFERDNVLNSISDEEVENFRKQTVFGDSFYESILLHIVHSIFFFKWSETQKIADVIPKMLINPGTKTMFHNIAKDAVEDRIERVLKNINNKEEKTMVFIRDTLKNFNKFLNVTEESFSNDITLDELITEIKRELITENINIQIVNSQNQIEESNKKFTFYIGCNKLSRGVTITSLITTYSFARPKSKSNADTVSQAARWLGYRELYKYFLTIYLSNDLIFDYDSINFTNEDLYNVLSTYEKNGNTIKDLPKKILIKRKDALIRPTRTTVSKQKETELDGDEKLEKMASKQSFFMSKSWHDSENDKLTSDDLNKIYEEHFKPKFENSSLKLSNLSIDNKLSDHKYITFDNIDKIEYLLGTKKFHKMIKSLDLPNDLFSKIRERNSSKKVILSFMTNSSNENYNRIYSNNNITTIPVGGRKFPISRQYVGDRYWFNDLNSKDYIIFQIYPIILKRNNKKDEEPIYKLALLQNVNQNDSINNMSNIYIIEGVH